MCLCSTHWPMGHSRPAAEHNLLSSASVFVCVCCCWNGNRRICTELSTGVWTFKGFSIFCRSEHAIKCVCVFEGGGGEKVRWSRICVNYTDIAAFPWRYVSFCLDIPWFMEACKKNIYIAVTCLTWSWQPEGDRWFTMTERHREHKEREREGMKTISHSWQVLLQALSPWNCSTTWLLRGRPTSPNT